jgi:hypothetical protein
LALAAMVLMVLIPCLETLPQQVAEILVGIPVLAVRAVQAEVHTYQIYPAKELLVKVTLEQMEVLAAVLEAAEAEQALLVLRVQISILAVMVVEVLLPLSMEQ